MLNRLARNPAATCLVLLVLDVRLVIRRLELEFRMHVRQSGLTVTVLDTDARVPLLPSVIPIGVCSKNLVARGGPMGAAFAR